MTLAEVISKEDISHSSESSNPETKKKRLRLNRSNKSHQDGAFKKLQTSVLDLLHVHHSVDNLENKDIQPPQQQQQQKESAPRHPSIIKSSDIARVLSKKSVTFASVFDPVDNENDTIWKLEPIIDKETASEEDLVTVITNSPINDQTTTDTNETTEPYPFRSEVPVSLTSSSNSPTDLNTTTTSSHRSRKKIIDHFTHHHRPKKLRHPLQTSNPVSPRNRSSSTPNLVLSSYSSPRPTRTMTISTNNQQNPPTTNTRPWFKLSNIVQFIRSFGTHLNRKQTNDTAKTKTNPHRHSTELKSNSELFY